ncbi:MAG: sigma-70 family RNA polymerase sigma factor [Planctomycetota bacterium]
MDHSYTTRLSLLGRLKDDPDDQASWSEFVARYQPMIQRWCRSFGLQPADANDVTQNVLLKIARQMRRFEYRKDGKFRAWLRTVVYHAWCDYLQTHKWKGTGDEAIHGLLQSVEARDDLIQKIEDEYDQQLFDEASRLVQRRVDSHIWLAFEHMALKHKSAKETAEELGITEGSAYVSKSRVQRMLTDEIANLERLIEQ